jgi:hypothetical protein
MRLGVYDRWSNGCKVPSGGQWLPGVTETEWKGGSLEQEDDREHQRCHWLALLAFILRQSMLPSSYVGETCKLIQGTVASRACADEHACPPCRCKRGGDNVYAC